MIAPEDRQSAADADLVIKRLENSLKDNAHQLKKDVNTGEVSDLFDSQILAQLEDLFMNSKSGYQSLTAKEFRDVISQYIPLPLVENVYRAIDVNDLGFVRYSDFTNYLIASEAGSSFSARNFMAKLSFLHTQEDDGTQIHRDMVDCMVYTKRPCPMLITGGRDGALNLWNPETLEQMTSIDHKNKNFVYKLELEKTMDTMMKAQSARRVTNNNKQPAKVSHPLFVH
jgi:hypothetical protein